MKKTLVLAVVGVISLLAASSVSAITYTATGNGSVTAYFYGSDAAYGSVIGMRVNGVATGIIGLQNHTTAPGTSLVLGNVSVGDTIEFFLEVSTGNPSGPPPTTYTLYSDPANNAGNIEYTTSSAFAGSLVPAIPAGTLVGWEDILGTPNGAGDYNDHQFVFTGPGLNVPDAGSTLAMLGGVMGLIAAFSRRLRR